MAGTSTPLVNPIFPGSGGTSGGGGGGSIVTGTPRTNRAAVVSLGPGVSSDLDSSQITVGNTGRLVGISYTGTIPVELTLHTVADGVASTSFLDLNSWNGDGEFINMADPRFHTVLGTAAVGFDGFRATVTNCDNNITGDIFVTFYWEEV